MLALDGFAPVPVDGWPRRTHVSAVIRALDVDAVESGNRRVKAALASLATATHRVVGP